MAVSSVRLFNNLYPSRASLIAYSTLHSGFPNSLGYNSFRVKGGLVSSISGSSRVRASVKGKGERTEDYPLAGDSTDNKKVAESWPRSLQRDFAGTPYVPVYVMLPLGVIDRNCELVDPEGLTNQLRILKSVNVDGVMIDCWWGIVEAHAPQTYNWSGYRRLFQIVRDLGLKLQVVMSFHECGGNVGDDVNIPLPQWVREIGDSNPDIYFTDREGRSNTECLTWGIDKERVLRGRTAVEVYFDYMRNFRVEFDDFFVSGVIAEIEVGMGPCGELRYPSYPVKHGWKYPGIGEFQCYDKYLMKRLKKAAEIRGHTFWGRAPDNSGSYNSAPHETGFFRDGGDYDSYYGRFFLNWYSQILVDHGDRVLALANLAFEGTCIAAKLSGIHWWYKTASHAAELTSGFYNPAHRDGYAPIAAMLKKHGVALNFTCVELRTLNQHEGFPEAMADPEGLVWQVLNAAWDVSIPVASENALPCYDREGYNKILENAKPRNDPDGRHLSAFTYLRLNPALIERRNFVEFERFVKGMHGKNVRDDEGLGIFRSFISGELKIPEKLKLSWDRVISRSGCCIKLIGANEEDDEEEIEMDVKEEDNENGQKHISAQMMLGADGVMPSTSHQFQIQQQLQEQVSTPGGGARRSRPLEEKERTKLRERHRRALTARILAGLRKHGNYNLRVRADINDVIAALAREAGWVVLPDGTTFPSRSQGSRPAGDSSAGLTSSSSEMLSQQAPPTSLQGVSSGYCALVEYNACHMKGVFMPTPAPYDLSSSGHSQSSGMVGNGGEQTESLPLIAGSMEVINDKQIIGLPPKLPERDFAGTPYVPVYVMLPLGVVNMKCELVDPDGLLKQLRVLKSINVDGVMIDCWWGIVEAHAPQEYNWNGYRKLFQMVHELKLKLQTLPMAARSNMLLEKAVAMQFVKENTNVVMSFHECGGNVGDDVCIPLPHWVAEIGRSNPDIFFTDREGRRNTECLSWGIDKERVLRGRTAVEVYFDFMRSFRVEFNEFFEDGIISMVEVGLGPCGELRYPSCPVKHGWRYPGIGEFQLPGIHWWYKTSSHAAELTAGFYNPCNRDGYIAIAAMLHKHGAALNFARAELQFLEQREDLQEALANPQGLVWQVLNAAWEACITVVSENAFVCHDRVGYNKILENVKPVNDPDGRHFSSFTYLRLTPLLMERQNFMEFERFVKRMHGEAVLYLQV
ncbi:hypothetical protein GOBAR_DD36725 [Gossypium barbadense]|nr:hypothetical protein GOBAR_DD36725 [Gossypium barbadense]